MCCRFLQQKRSIKKIESNIQIWHWEIEMYRNGVRRKIQLYSEIYGVGSTAGNFWHKFNIQSRLHYSATKTWIYSYHYRFFFNGDKNTLPYLSNWFIEFKNISFSLIRYNLPLTLVESNWQIIPYWFPAHQVINGFPSNFSIQFHTCRFNTQDLGQPWVQKKNQRFLL